MTGTDADLRRLSMDAAKEVPGFPLNIVFSRQIVIVQRLGVLIDNYFHV